LHPAGKALVRHCETRAAARGAQHALPHILLSRLRPWLPQLVKCTAPVAAGRTISLLNKTTQPAQQVCQRAFLL
jgi:hypothetical protein